ncbi:MAG: hypothetical protein LC722_09085 [Actinobacteria bacterium]|nr:hypothetical protein [Actinomycetota bacterium]
MPVVVTGAGGIAGRALLRRLAPLGGELRALASTIAEVPSVREIIPKAAAPDLEDVEEIALMLHDVHTLIHVLPEPDLPQAALERALGRTTEWVVAAAGLARARRFVLLSVAGASVDAANPFLRAAAEAEAAVEVSAIPERVVIRAGTVYGPGGLWLDAWRAMVRPALAVVPGTGRQMLAPVYVADVAQALAAADDRAMSPSGTFGLEGPDRLSMDDVVDAVAGKRRRKVHVSPRRATGRLRLSERSLEVYAAELLAADGPVEAAPTAAAEFGIRLTPFEDGLRASA